MDRPEWDSIDGRGPLLKPGGMMVGKNNDDRSLGPGRDEAGERSFSAAFPTLTRRRWAIMVRLHVDGVASAGQLAAEFNLSVQSLSRHLDAMYRDGLVEPDARWGLRRPRVWRITPRGIALISANADSWKRRHDEQW